MESFTLKKREDIQPRQFPCGTETITSTNYNRFPFSIARLDNLGEMPKGKDLKR
jgi:hypothetical protein